MIAPTKKFYASKTFWFNTLALVLAVGLPVLSQYGYTGEVPAEWGVFVIPAIALVNLVLRFITKEPIA
jgi:hypothetical protein